MIATSELSEITDRLAELPQRTPEEVRQWEWKNVIRPEVQAGGYDSRFLVETTTWPRNGQRKAFEVAREAIQAQGAIIALVGRRGTGKTTITAQLAIDLAWRWHKFYGLYPEERGTAPIGLARYMKLTSLSNALKPLYSDIGTTKSEALTHYLELITECGLLIIDEKHEADEIKVASRILTDVLDRRYAKRKDSIIISNETAVQFQQSTSDSILSRIKEHGSILACEWESFR